MEHELPGGLLDPDRVPALRVLVHGTSEKATGPTWQTPCTSPAAGVKGAKVYRTLAPVFRALGYDDGDRALVSPLFGHLWAVVYEADWAYEAHQRSGGTGAGPGSWWPEHLRAYLGSLELLDATVERHLAGLEEYFELETRLLGSADSFDEADLARAIRLRCSDIRAFLAVAAALTGRPWARELSALLGPMMSFIDLEDDLRSVEQDAAEGSFNTYGLAVRRWGEAGARHRLDRTGDELLGETAQALSAAPPDTLRAMWVLLGRPSSDAEARLLARTAPGPDRELLAGLRHKLLDGTPGPFEPYWRLFDTPGGDTCNT
ncbi:MULTISPECIES: hypothetical protein [unclassified Streptomyces]|uniref:hypothetical protein n=1 Tax=unclassified Streptomyces TaxID=2593676 RepID=UPI0011E60D26|nr:hypothetical protein [Streptomyces sp. sk2.1]TXS59998.1 hypothetical protein EAO76_42245 [Streptomyces sp. sk2.1]